MLFLYTDLVKYYMFWTLFSVAEVPQHKKQILEKGPENLSTSYIPL